jgi:hypothetical protein
MDWTPILVALAALVVWFGVARFVLPRFGIKGG